MSELSGAIFVVEDDHDIRDTLLETLDDEGFRAVGAGSCAEALERLRASPDAPALILLDLMMPAMSGAEFRQIQLADPKLAPIPVVVVSAASNGDERARELQPAAYLKKPIRLAALREVAERFAKPR